MIQISIYLKQIAKRLKTSLTEYRIVNDNGTLNSKKKKKRTDI